MQLPAYNSFLQSEEPPMGPLTIVAIDKDKDKNSQQAVKWAVDHLLTNTTQLTLVHVWQKSSASITCNYSSLFITFHRQTYEQITRCCRVAIGILALHLTWYPNIFMLKGSCEIFLWLAFKRPKTNSPLLSKTGNCRFGIKNNEQINKL